MEKNINIQQALFFSHLKKPDVKDNKLININYLAIVRIKMRLTIFLVFSQYGLACKYEIIVQISIIIGCRITFSITWSCDC